MTSRLSISFRSTYKFLSRYRLGDVVPLVDLRSVYCIQRLALDTLQLLRVITVSYKRYSLRCEARILAVPLSTVGWVLQALQFGRLRKVITCRPVQSQPVDPA
jgi:hypothetical protein